jgi:hypothetical protein
VFIPPPQPFGSGYGGVGFPAHTNVAEEAGASFGLTPYGSSGYPAIPFSVDGGYGGDPFGTGVYGSSEVTPPRVTSVVSLTGTTVEVFFNEPMDALNPALIDAASYTLAVLAGAAPATVLSVVKGLMDPPGVLSVILTHTGTTIGGTYELAVSGPTDVSGNLILDVRASFYAKGDAPLVTCVAEDGSHLRFTFDKEMLDLPDSTTGEATSYLFESSPAYPIALTPTAMEFPVAGDNTSARMTVKGMTSLEYTATVGPAEAIVYAGGAAPGTAINPAGGSSTPVGGTALSMSKKVGQTHGRQMLDTSGRLAPGTTFRLDFTLNASNTVYAPALAIFPSPEVLDVVLSDGAPGLGIEATITFRRNALGDEEIRLTSGGYTAGKVIPWGDRAHKVSLVRNDKAGTYTLLLDEAPVIVAAIAALNGASTFGPGVQWLLKGAWTTTGLLCGPVRVTASNTLFAFDWNFLHEGQAVFEGDATLTKDWLLTKRGPLVRGWGDATPATKGDVSVRVNGGEVTVKAVNPYEGRVTLAVPVPLLPPGDPQGGVAVDYKWFATPTMPMAGLNTAGLTLNKYDRSTGHHDPAHHGEQPKKQGSMSPHRFPMAVVLGPMTRPKPKLVGHRYMGFERAYSALLNSPTTLRLNQPPGRASVLGFDHKTLAETVSYEATTLPGDAPDAWAEVGNGEYSLQYASQVLRLSDSANGTFDPVNDPVAYFKRDLLINDPASMRIVARVATVEGDTTPDGVFSGVSVGFHDNDRLYLVGLLVINGVRHVGVLLDPDTPHLRDSWVVGPTTTATAVAKNKLVFPANTIPDGVTAGTRMQVLTGAQAGVYTAESVVRQTDGEVTVTLVGGLPVSIGLLGGKYPEVTFEVDHTTSYTLRLEADSEAQTLEVSVAGALRGTLLSIDGVTTTLPSPTRSPLVFSTSGQGEVFFGSVSRKATSVSEWSFVRYAVMPDQTSVLGHAVVVNAEMSDLPEANPDDLDWFPTGSFGRSFIENNADRLVLRSEATSDTLDFSWAYRRIEPFLIPEATCDVRLKFRVDSGTLGGGDAQVVLEDGQKETRLTNLLYAEGLFPKHRELVSLPSISMAGLQPPEEQGWTLLGAAGEAHAAVVTTNESVDYSRVLDTSSMLVPDAGGRVIEAALRVVSHTPNGGGGTGIRVLGDALGVGVGFELRTGKVALIDGNGNLVREYPFTWNDQAEHLYRVVVDADAMSVVLTVDDTVQLPIEAFANFNGGDNRCHFGALSTGGSAAEVEWRDVSVSAHPPASLKRTIGIYKGGNPQDINSYEIPRRDTSDAPNGAASGPDIEEMDWRSDLDVRILRDPSWGVTVYRPDMPPPPYYAPEQEGVAGSGFIADTVEPSAGWINVEWADLPYKASTFGSVTFGAPDASSITQQRWDYVRYRIWRHPTQDRRAPRHMVLNQHNVITSGERTLDTGLEKVVVQVLDRTRVTLRPAHIYADSILKIEDDGQLLTWHDWTFDPASQTVTLGLDGTGEQRLFSSDTAKVTLTFAPSSTVTSTWLKQQPLLQSVTLLNEGTPPYPKNQTGHATKEVVFGSALNNPHDVLNDDPAFNLNDPKKTLVFEDDTSAIYEDLDFYELDDGGTQPIASICEGLLPGGPSGWNETEKKATGGHVLDLSGTMLWQGNVAPATPDFDQLGGTPGAILMASGGNYLNPVVDAQGNHTGAQVPLGGLLNQAVTFPTAPATGPAWTGQGRVRQRTDWFMHLWAVVTEDGDPGTALEEILPTIDDTTAPDGTTHPSGAVQWITIGPGDFSHIGPWGGIVSLTPDPGHGMTQGSLLAGGEVTIQDGLHDPLLGMVCEGGVALPVGTTTTSTVTPP